MDTALKVDDGREFNQTKEHDHRKGHECWCGFGVGSAITENTLLDEPSPRHVSPAINEFRVKQLEEELRVANTRIAGFEKLVATFAEHFDRLRRYAQAGVVLEGKDFDVPCGTINPLDAALPNCQLPSNHTGPCSSEPLKAA